MLLLFMIPGIVLAQIDGDHQIWNTEVVTGKLDNTTTIFIETEFRYSDQFSQINYQHVDFGVIQKINKPIAVSIYYREIYELKAGRRVREVRPHFDLVYKYKGFKLRFRNEYQMREFGPDNYRLRIRPEIKFINKSSFTPYINNEIFLVWVRGYTDIIRNRVQVGVNYKIKKFTLSGYYMVQSDHFWVISRDWFIYGIKIKVSF